MYSSNSFNVCPHCGKANSLNARYCSGCGKQLAVPEEVVVCHKCHKPNSAMASFCGSCGAPLRVGAQTKICPKCHKEVDANSNVCSCGYSFSNVKYASPESAALDKKSDKKASKSAARSAALADPRNKGARAIAVFSLVLLLLFAYLIIVPAVGRPAFLKDFDKGIFNVLEVEPMYGYDLVYQPIKGCIDSGFSAVKDAFGIGGILWAVIIVILTFTMLFQLVASIGQVVSAKRHKKMNIFHLVMAIITTLCLGFLWLFHALAADKTSGFVVTMRNIFMPTVGGMEMYGLGLVIYLIPVYYWLCFLFSCLFKQKKIKEKAV